uniref:Uncharacterized protein n=1 Tax=Cacopsylla melanoneura TaxID=428564 RepID=A0A8D8S571_9HEMI
MWHTSVAGSTLGEQGIYPIRRVQVQVQSQTTHRARSTQSHLLIGHGPDSVNQFHLGFPRKVIINISDKFQEMKMVVILTGIYRAKTQNTKHLKFYFLNNQRRTLLSSHYQIGAENLNITLH